MTDLDRDKLHEIARYSASQGMTAYAEYLKEMAGSEWWINAKSIVPKSRVEVLCLLASGKKRVGYYVDGMGVGESKDGVGYFDLDTVIIRPTHWMPLPEPPK